MVEDAVDDRTRANSMSAVQNSDTVSCFMRLGCGPWRCREWSGRYRGSRVRCGWIRRRGQL